MTLFEAIKPKTFYLNTLRVFRSLINWRFYKKTMRTLVKNGSLKLNGMRLDKRYRAYYVLNLEPEILMMGAEALELERSRVYESLVMKKLVFEKAGLGELIEATTDRIKSADHYAYLIQIKYRPIVNIWDVIYSTVWLTAAGIASYYLIQVGARYQEIFDWINNAMTAK